MKWQGVRHAKVLKTPEDVLEHSYGRSSGISKETPTDPAPSAPPAPPAPEADPELSIDDLSDEEYANHLVDTMKKDELIALAESLGLESDGNKSDIAARIVAHQRSGG